MRRPPSRSRLAAALLALVLAGCLDDPPVAPSAGGVSLRVDAQLAASPVERTLQLRVGFIHATTERRVDLPVTPAQLVVTGGETVQHAVAVQLAPCFAEGARSGGGGGRSCPLIVELTLVDAAGGLLASEARVVDVPVGARSAVVPPFSLGVTSLGGVVRSALSNQPVAGVTVDLFAGEATTGSPLATSVTGSSGTYLFRGVTAGAYTLRASGGGILPSTRGPIDVGTSSVSGDIVVSPVLSANELRVVLSWGAAPADLDSHLYGPSAAGDYHVYYAAPGALPFAELDRDDTDAFGPETITIRQLAVGTHVFAVHDFLNQNLPTSRALANSGARVQLYRSSGLVAEFTVPNLPGTLWTVFELNGATITPVNRVSSATPGTRPQGAGASRVAPANPALSLSRSATPLPTKPESRP